MQNRPMQSANNGAGWPEIPAPEQSLVNAKLRLRHTLRRGELVWLLGERYDPQMPCWDIDILRQGAAGRWVRQRYRYDAAAQVLYFLGEDALSDTQFRERRRGRTLLPTG